MLPRVRSAFVTVLGLLVLAALPSAAAADHSQPPTNLSKLDYAPTGFFKPGDPIPSTSAPPALQAGGIYNPSGKWNAYDTNVFESLGLPDRQADDQTSNDPLGNGGMPYGLCPPDPAFAPYGKCANHQREYMDYFERTMKAILGPFGVVVKRYPFDSPGAGTPRPGVPGGAPATASGRSYNIAAVVPGADHPDQSVIVGAHYDVTDNAPAPAWDSSEGHAELIRMAKIMADYWTATGTRPSATVKFVPWDQEESGTLGSKAFIADNIPPGEERQIRGYFNVDPCAGAWPAYYHGLPSEQSRIPMMLQLPDPANQTSKERQAYFTKFNARALTIPDDVMNRDDDTVQVAGGTKPIFISPEEAKNGENGGTSDRGDIVEALGGLLLFSSDYANFESIGVPFFNPGPDMFGPHADPTTSQRSSSEGVSILHTPRDNLTTINLLTGPDQTGLTVSDGWLKGMEFCAQMESWYMLQPEMGGAQTSNPDVVAYYEALPNEAIQRQNVTFDAGGSYQYDQLATRAFTSDSDLTYSWDFGDGTTGTGKVVEHAYPEVGRYASKLTVRNVRTGQSNSMSLPVTVVGSNFEAPVLTKPASTDEDGTFDLAWTFAGQRSGQNGFAVQESDDFRTMFADSADGDPSAKWTVAESGDGAANAQKWQSSASGNPPRGNLRHSGGAAYWTGANPPSPSPTNTTETLTLKQPLEIPKEGEPKLSYWNYLDTEAGDQGLVQVALTDGNPATPLDFKTVDAQNGEGYTGSANPSPTLTNRTVDLGAYKGKKLVVRFTYVYDGTDAVASQPFGWYVDDIAVTTGTWHDIGRTDAKARTFQAFGRPTGTHAYRVVGTYTDGVRTAPSNEESVRVLNGPAAPAGPGGAGGTGTGGSGSGGAVPCVPRNGFASARVKPAGRGLRFVVRRAEARRFSVDVFQDSRGRRVLRERRVAHFTGRTGSFAWDGRGRAGRSPTDGYFFARLKMRLASGRYDVRRVALVRRGGRFRVRPPYSLRDSCALLASFKLTRPVFGGTRRSPLQASFRLNRSATVSIVMRRGAHVVRRYTPSLRAAGVLYRLKLPTRGLARGDYQVVLEVRRSAAKLHRRLVARRL